MLDQIKKVFRDRDHASRSLYEKLKSYQNCDGVVVALPPGGVPVANYLALTLQLPVEITMARRIRHPAHSERSIGAVTADEVFLLDGNSSIPQHYIYRQIQQLQHRLQAETNVFHQTISKQNLKNKTVILCDTFINNTERIAVCLQTLKIQRPSRIIVATLLATSKALFLMNDQEIDFHYVDMVLNKDISAVMEMYDEDEYVQPFNAPFSTTQSIQ